MYVGTRNEWCGHEGFFRKDIMIKGVYNGSDEWYIGLRQTGLLPLAKTHTRLACNMLATKISRDRSKSHWIQ